MSHQCLYKYIVKYSMRYMGAKVYRGNKWSKQMQKHATTLNNIWSNRIAYCHINMSVIGDGSS